MKWKVWFQYCFRYISIISNFFYEISEIKEIENLGQYNSGERDVIYNAFSKVPQPTFGITGHRFRSWSIVSQSRDSSVASDVSIEMPGDETPGDEKQGGEIPMTKHKVRKNWVTACQRRDARGRERWDTKHWVTKSR